MDNYTKRIILHLCVTAAAIALFIGVTVFTQWGWNPSEWTEAGRALWAIIGPIWTGWANALLYWAGED